MKTILLTLFFTVLISLVSVSMVQAQSWNPFSSEKVLIIALDQSGSLKDHQKQELVTQVRQILETKVEVNDHVFVIPIHAFTASAGYIAQTKLDTKKSGRSGALEFKKKKQALVTSIEEAFTQPLGKAAQFTDLIGLWNKIAEIQGQTDKSVEVYVISDMIHDTPQFTFASMKEWHSKGQLEQISKQGRVEHFKEPISVYVIQPSGIIGTIPNQEKQLMKRIWTDWFISIGAQVKHWDTEIY